MTNGPAAHPPNICTRLRTLAHQLICGSADLPDFEKAVTVVLATFTVFTGYTINLFMNDFNLKTLMIKDISVWKFWAFFAFVSLMLRYIFGSAIHLNATYVGKTKYEEEAGPPRVLSPKKDPPKSQSVFFLFKDFLFLVLFGLLAVHLGGATGNFKSFVHRSMWFIGAGFAWSISDYYLRRIWCLFTVEGRDKDWPPLRWVDFIFLGLFACAGAWAFWVAYQVLYDGKDIDLFILVCALIVGLGLVFSLVNLCASRDYQNVPDGEWPGAFWRLWVWLDGIQFLVAGWIACVTDPNNMANVDCMAKVLAATFIVFLLLDLGAMIRAVQLKWK
jgi:hypothetical protein